MTQQAATPQELARSIDRLVDQVTRWTPARWAAPTAAGTGPRASVMHALAQRLADLEADLAGRPRREVPRFENHLVLPDQVRVVARDLLAAQPAPEVLAVASAAVAETRAALAEPRAFPS